MAKKPVSKARTPAGKALTRKKRTATATNTGASTGAPRTKTAGSKTGARGARTKTTGSKTAGSKIGARGATAMKTGARTGAAPTTKTAGSKTGARTATATKTGARTGAPRTKTAGSKTGAHDATAEPKPTTKATAEPKPTSGRKARPKPARAVAAKKLPPAVRAILTALEAPREAARCTALVARLADATPKRARELAAAAIEADRPDRSLAWSYLRVLAEPGDRTLAAADDIAWACARLDRDRKALAPVFAATWSRAADTTAVEAAYVNLSRELLEDPRLLAAGVEAALRLGDRATAVDRTARLERARRLAPRLATITAEVASELLPDDRAHVYARVLAAPSDYSSELATAAIAALAEDPAIPDISLSSAIAALPGQGAELVAHWRRRIADGAAALGTRLLALFEWAALTADRLESLLPLLHALHPAAGRTDVFAQLDNALASERGVVREAALRGWIADPAGMAAFDDVQVDKLVRSTIALAEEADAGIGRVAREALATLAHPGAAPALIDALSRPRARRAVELRGALYTPLARLAHPVVVPCLIDRLFGEREAYRALVDALGGWLDAALHRAVLGALARRDREADAVHAATLYAELLVEQRLPRLLVELARTVMAREPSTSDDARRLRYLFEHATVAAIAIHALDDARAFLARVHELPARPLSDLHAPKTPAPLADAGSPVAALESGELASALAREAADLAAARAAGTPIPATDARLAALAGAEVASRLLDDRARGVAWFFDRIGELHVYDGYGLVPPAFVIAGDRRRGIADMAAFASGKVTDAPASRLAALASRVPVVDERVTFFAADHARARELIRIGDRVLILDGATAGAGPIPLRAIGIKLPGFIAARDVVARFAQNPPDGLARVDSWSAVRREYAVPVGTARIGVVGSSIEGSIPETLPPIERDHADAAAAVRALHAWEGRLFAAGGWLAKIWIDARAR